MRLLRVGALLVMGLVVFAGVAAWAESARSPAAGGTTTTGHTVIEPDGTEIYSDPPWLLRKKFPDGTQESWHLSSDGTRMTEKTFPPGGEITSTLLVESPDGQRKEITNYRGGRLMETTLYPDGKEIMVERGPEVELTTTRTPLPDGARHTSYPDGREEIYRLKPDGTIVYDTTYPHGTRIIEQRFPAGTREIEIVEPDGTKIVERVAPEGTLRTTTHPDGTQVIRYPDGTEGVTFPDGMRGQLSRRSDGSMDVVSTNPDGTLTIRDADGTSVVRPQPDGGTVSVTTHPDGTTTTTRTFPDGRRATERPDGTQVIAYPNGDQHIVTTRADGATVFEITDRWGHQQTLVRHPDGTQTEHTPGSFEKTLFRNPDGRVVELESNALGVQRTAMRSADGRSEVGLIMVRADGSKVTETTNPDGSKTTVTRTPEGKVSWVTTAPDGTIVHAEPDWKREVVRMEETQPDGTTATIVALLDGTEKVTQRRPNGEQTLLTTLPDGTRTKAVTSPDGTMRVTLPDGTQTTRQADGVQMVRTVKADGGTVTVTLRPDGTMTSETVLPDGTQTVATYAAGSAEGEDVEAAYEAEWTRLHSQHVLERGEALLAGDAAAVKALNDRHAAEMRQLQQNYANERLLRDEYVATQRALMSQHEERWLKAKETQDGAALAALYEQYDEQLRAAQERYLAGRQHFRSRAGAESAPPSGADSFREVQTAQASAPEAQVPDNTGGEESDDASRELKKQELLNYCGELLEAAPDPTFTYRKKREMTTTEYWSPDGPMDCSRDFLYDEKVAYPSVGVEYQFDIRATKRFAAAALTAYDQLLEPRWERRWTTIDGLDLEKTSYWENTKQYALYALRQSRPNHQVLLQASLGKPFTVAIWVYPPGTPVPWERFQKPERSY